MDRDTLSGRAKPMQTCATSGRSGRNGSTVLLAIQ